MVFSRRDTRAGTASRLVVALVFLCAGLQPLRAQVDTREDTPVTAVVSPSRVREGDRFVVTVEIGPVDAALVTVEEPEYPASIRRVGGVQVISRGIGPAGPRATVIQLEMQAVQAGRRVISAITVLTPEYLYRTEPALVEISLRDTPDRVPYDMAWRVHRERVFEGQSVVVTLDMVHVTEFTFPDSVSVQPPAGALFEEAQGLGEIESLRYGEIELFRLPVASYLLTPSAAGSLVLPAAEIQALGFTRRAPAVTIPVLPLPPGAGETGAVGQFVFTSQLSAAEIGLDESVELQLLVQGTGNLPFFQFPDVPAEGLIVSDTDASQYMVAGIDGFAGQRQQIIRYRPAAAGDFRIQVPAFAWFDPSTERVRQGVPRIYTIRVLDRAQAELPVQRALPSLLDAEQVRNGATLNLYRLPGTYLAMTPGAIMVVVVLYVRRRRRESIALFSVVLLLGAGLFLPGPDNELLREVAARYSEGDYREAYLLSERMLEQDPQQPGLLYNAGVTAFAADHRAQSVFWLRRALVARPFFLPAHEALDFIETELGLERQLSRPRTIHPDGPLLAAVVLYYLIAIMVVIPRRRRRAGYAIVLIVMLLMLVGAVAGFGYTLYQRGQPVAVVGPDTADLKRIPEAGAQTWLILDAGTAVRPLTSRDGFLLVRTGYGIDGWVTLDQLLMTE